jgi:hypothetical protein
MTILNGTIPYLMKIHAEKPNYPPIVFDYFVGGYPRAHNVDMGSFAFYVSDNLNHNVTGRVFEAFTNKTFSDDYTVAVY